MSHAPPRRCRRLHDRVIALTRKNALFAGSDAGAEHWAVVAWLIESCKLPGIEPHRYLADVITRIVNGHPNPVSMS
jgi:transposase